MATLLCLHQHLSRRRVSVINHTTLPGRDEHHDEGSRGQISPKETLCLHPPLRRRRSPSRSMFRQGRWRRTSPVECTRILPMVSTNAPSAPIRSAAIHLSGRVMPAGSFCTWAVSRDGPKMRAQQPRSPSQKMTRLDGRDSGVVQAAICHRKHIRRRITAGVRRKKNPKTYQACLLIHVDKPAVASANCQNRVPIRAI